jgi:hypothetical protein
MYSTPIDGSADDVWAVVTDAATWGEWWLLGSPRLEGGGWAPGSQLVWEAADGRDRTVARLDQVEPGLCLEFEFVEGGDGLLTRRKIPVSWVIRLEQGHAGTKYAIERTNRPNWRVGKVIDAELDVRRRLEAAVGRRVRASGDIPDVKALRDAGDVEGLLVAVEHREAWIRAQALGALGWVRAQAQRPDSGGSTSPSDPALNVRVVDAALASARDPEAAVRRAAASVLLASKDERAGDALDRLADDPDPDLRRALDADTRMMEFRMKSTRGYTGDQRSRLRSAATVSFGEAPTEPFLASKLAVYVHKGAAFAGFDEPWEREETLFGTHATGTVTSRLLFPQICAGCLDPTDRSLLDRTFLLRWERRDRVDLNHVEVRSTSVRAGFAVPVCERCVALSVDDLFDVSFETRTAGDNVQHDWVRLRFPNLAYNQPFCDANAGITVDRNVGPMARSTEHMTLFEVPRMSRRQKADRDLGLETWTLCREMFGFHRYAQVKSELVELGPDADRPRLEALAGEQSLTLDQLRQVEVVAGAEIPALRALDGAS